MNLKLIDTALATYKTKLDEADMARLDFFRKVWEVQSNIAAGQAQGQVYQVPELLELLGNTTPVFEQKGVLIAPEVLSLAIEQVVACFVEHEGFSQGVQESLASVKWDRLVAASSLDVAGSDPAAYGESMVELLLDDGLDEQAAGMGAQAVLLALKALLEKPAQTAVQAWRKIDRAEHPLKCPVCGGAAAVARVGDSQAVQGRGKELWCVQCGTTWNFERVRCARCGTQNQSHLHFFNIEGDDAHRLATCDECGGYVRTVFQADALAPFAFEVEDVLMAKLDLVAYQKAAADAAKAL